MKFLIRRKEVNTSDAVRKTFPAVLIKDLAENERICPTCNGLGMRIANNIYGLKGDESENAKREHFPYKHQALTFCPDCFNGVQELCPYCGVPYTNQSYRHCSCEGQRKADEEIDAQKWKNIIANATAVNENDVETTLYCEEASMFFNSTDDFFEYYFDNCSDFCNRPERLWVCRAEMIHIDAESVVEGACENLYEDASEQCNIEELQELLNKWCSKQNCTLTYYPCYKQYVTIDWNEYEKNTETNIREEQVFHAKSIQRN